MLKKYRIFLLSIVTLFAITYCSPDEDDNYDPIPVSPVKVDLTQVPYQTLSEYNFFDGEMKNMNPSLNVIPYEPSSTLFTDYAHKKRFVWLPSGTKATYNGDSNILELPVGSAIIKNFYYSNLLPSNTQKILETRVMIRNLLVGYLPNIFGMMSKQKLS